MRLYVVLFLLVIFFFSAEKVKAQYINKQELPKKVRILFLFDASGSMWGQFAGEVKFVAAKKILTEIVDSLKVNPQLELGLRVYGHQFAKEQNNCTDTKLEVRFKPNNHDEIISKIDEIRALGVTPISYSLQQAADDFPLEKNVRNIIIIITDGLESCGGDPCEVSMALQKKNVFLKPFIIGIGGEKNWQEAFNCMGTYLDAQNYIQYKYVLNQAIKQSLYRTTVIVNLLDSKDQPIETNVNMTFVNRLTGKSKYDFVHKMIRSGIADTLEIDPLINYDLIVNTIPPVELKNIRIEAGEHNTLTVKTPQGALKISQPGVEKYKIIPRAILSEAGKQETLNIQKVNLTEKYLIGKYDLQILTLPIIEFKDVEIKQSEITLIEIPRPGSLVVLENIPAFADIFQINKDGDRKLIHSFPEGQTKCNLGIQPGKYVFVFRMIKAKHTIETFEKVFEIKSGETTTLDHKKL